MFNKLKNKLRLKLIHWLEIDKLNSNLINVSKDLKKSINKNSEDIYELKTVHRRDYQELDNKYDSLHRTIQECVKMGADIQQLGGYKGGTGSWAVVCFRRGNQDIVKFIDLVTHGRNGMDMLNYLKQFDASRYSIDVPWGYGLHRDIFYIWDREEE